MFLYILWKVVALVYQILFCCYLHILNVKNKWETQNISNEDAYEIHFNKTISITFKGSVGEFFSCYAHFKLNIRHGQIAAR